MELQRSKERLYMEQLDVENVNNECKAAYDMLQQHKDLIIKAE